MPSLTTRTRAERCFGRSESSSEKPGRRSGRAHIGKRGAAAGVCYSKAVVSPTDGLGGPLIRSSQGQGPPADVTSLS